MCRRAVDHFGLGLTKIDPLLTKICAKMIVTFLFRVTLTFRPEILLIYILAYKSQNLRQNLDVKVRGRLKRGS